MPFLFQRNTAGQGICPEAAGQPVQASISLHDSLSIEVLRHRWLSGLLQYLSHERASCSFYRGLHPQTKATPQKPFLEIVLSSDPKAMKPRRIRT